MNLKEQETLFKIQQQLKAGLTSILGQSKNKNTVQQVSLATQKLMANIEADTFGYKITECDTLWNTFTLKQKAKWILYNVVVPSMGEAARLKIDLKNEKAFWEQRLEEIANAEEYDEDEDLHFSYLQRDEYPDYAVPSPKDVISVKTEVKLKNAINFVPISLNMQGLDAQLRGNNET